MPVEGPPLSVITSRFGSDASATTVPLVAGSRVTRRAPPVLAEGATVRFGAPRWTRVGEEQRALDLYESTNVSVGMSYAYTGASPQIACGKGRETSERAQAGAVPLVGEMRCEPGVSLMGIKALYLSRLPGHRPGGHDSVHNSCGSHTVLTATRPKTAPLHLPLRRAAARRPKQACASQCCTLRTRGSTHT